MSTPAVAARDRKIKALAGKLKEAQEALEHAVLWIEDFAIPFIGDDHCEGGNSLVAGLQHKIEEIQDMLADY